MDKQYMSSVHALLLFTNQSIYHLAPFRYNIATVPLCTETHCVKRLAVSSKAHIRVLRLLLDDNVEL